MTLLVTFGYIVVTFRLHYCVYWVLIKSFSTSFDKKKTKPLDDRKKNENDIDWLLEDIDSSYKGVQKKKYVKRRLLVR